MRIIHLNPANRCAEEIDAIRLEPFQRLLGHTPDALGRLSHRGRAVENHCAGRSLFGGSPEAREPLSKGDYMEVK